MGGMGAGGYISPIEQQGDAMKLAAMMALCACCAEAGDLQLEITGCRPGSSVQVALYDSARGFGSEHAEGASRRTSLVAHGDRLRVDFAGLPSGRYAVSAFDDVNGNGRLDRNFAGFPVEPYGFSHDARRVFLAPDFEKAAFELRDDVVFETIHLK